MTFQFKKRWPARLLLGVVAFILGAALFVAPAPAQIEMGGKRDKNKKEEKPQYPMRKFKGTISTIKLEKRQFLLDTPDGLAILVQIDDLTKIRYKKEKKGQPDVLFADLKKGDAAEVSGQLPPTRILMANKISLENPVKK